MFSNRDQGELENNTDCTLDTTKISEEIEPSIDLSGVVCLLCGKSDKHIVNFRFIVLSIQWVHEFFIDCVKVEILVNLTDLCVIVF